MALIADVLLLSGALSVALYCFVLSRRLRQFTDLERGVGGAIAILSVQVDDLSKALQQTEAATRVSANGLAAQTKAAQAAGNRLELLMASLHDLPEPTEKEDDIDPFFVREPVFVSEGR